jgi:YVTN family beta-propeller protein
MLNPKLCLDGQNVYLLPRNSNYVSVVNTATNSVTRKIGPLLSGVRPSTINGSQSLIFTTATGYLGFQVSDVNTGQVLYTVPVAGFNAPPNPTPSHGISLSPDERELWVMDRSNSYVHVFDVSHLPGSVPVQVADLPLSHWSAVVATFK